MAGRPLPCDPNSTCRPPAWPLTFWALQTGPHSGQLLLCYFRFLLSAGRGRGGFLPQPPKDKAKFPQQTPLGCLSQFGNWFLISSCRTIKQSRHENTSFSSLFLDSLFSAPSRIDPGIGRGQHAVNLNDWLIQGLPASHSHCN